MSAIIELQSRVQLRAMKGACKCTFEALKQLTVDRGVDSSAHEDDLIGIFSIHILGKAHARRFRSSHEDLVLVIERGFAAILWCAASRNVGLTCVGSQ